MKVVLFGATGMVGQGVLRECLLDPDVEKRFRGCPQRQPASSMATKQRRCAIK